MLIKEVPQLEDNYAYILADEASKQAAAIDPVEPKKVLKAAEELGVTIGVILTTHKHWDHAGGNNEIAKLLPGVPICGGAIDNVEACTMPVEDGDELSVGDSVIVKCLHTPGHTMGHICYFVEDGQDERAVFTGDTLFIGGAGKFFEGSPTDMYGSLYGKLATLPADTSVYCGHEYTEANYRFALSVEPGNSDLQRVAAQAGQLRKAGMPTVPSSIGKEMATNPFMRVNEPSIKAAVPGGQTMSPEDVLGAVREMKNNFR